MPRITVTPELHGKLLILSSKIKKKYPNKEIAFDDVVSMVIEKGLEK